jgi:hypothetical protein
MGKCAHNGNSQNTLAFTQARGQNHHGKSFYISADSNQHVGAFAFAKVGKRLHRAYAVDIRSWHVRLGVAVSCPDELHVNVVVPATGVAGAWHRTVHDAPAARAPTIVSGTCVTHVLAMT